MSEYRKFIEGKHGRIEPAGFDPKRLNTNLFDWQQDVVRWAVRVGRCDLFERPGLGKTIQQLAWADAIVREGGVKRALLVAPLAVSHQTQREAERFGIETDCRVCRSQSEVDSGINITNYEKLDKFDLSKFDAVVLDESSILKGLGPTRQSLTDAFRETRYRLPCSATPAPNDWMELGNHAEFTGVMTRMEMLSMFFVHDGGETSKWRLRGHAAKAFWEWMCEWSIMLRSPADLGYDAAGYDLPPLRMHEHVIEQTTIPAGQLFATDARSLMERRQARSASTDERCEFASSLVNASEEPWLVWCDLNRESEMLAKLIPDAVEVRGSHSPEQKEESLAAFSEGRCRVLVTKPSICGFGMNWQHCCKTAFVGLSDSFEKFFQAVRRCWRFGQVKPVDVHVVIADTEGAVLVNIKRKESDAERMLNAMIGNMADITAATIRGSSRRMAKYAAGKQLEVPSWLT